MLRNGLGQGLGRREGQGLARKGKVLLRLCRRQLGSTSRLMVCPMQGKGRCSSCLCLIEVAYRQTRVSAPCSHRWFGPYHVLFLSLGGAAMRLLLDHRLRFAGGAGVEHRATSRLQGHRWVPIAGAGLRGYPSAVRR